VPRTAVNDAIRNGATMHEVREFAGHADIRTTELYFVRNGEDAEVAARKILIRLTGRKSKSAPCRVSCWELDRGVMVSAGKYEEPHDSGLRTCHSFLTPFAAQT
jgi:hypothetical protein